MAENGQDETALQDEFDGLQDGEAEAGNIEGGAATADESGIEDPELEAIKARVKEMEEEAEKLKEMQTAVDLKMMTPPAAGASGFPTMEEKIETDNRSIYVGNVDYQSTAEELEQHFHGCGSINRVTIQCDKFSGHPKGFAYVEFADKESVTTSLALDDSLFRGRQIKVCAKRTNRPGISTTNRGRRPRRGGGGGYRGGGGGGYSPGYNPYGPVQYPIGLYSPRSRGRGYSRYRRAAFYSPY